MNLTETAINIGYSCKLLTDEMEEIYVIDGETEEEVLQQMEKAYDEMQKIISGETVPSHQPEVGLLLLYQ